MNGVFCGNGTLLIQCAEAFLEKGGQCSGIISSDTQIAEWARSKEIPVLGTPEDPKLGGLSVDWLFSVANLSVLPEELIAQAKTGAINFHDGPLPDLAGRNVPVWAILSGAEQHAVTWHEMTMQVDAGGIYRTKSFPISGAETAFSLNAKCYEVGLETFRDLLEDLFVGTLNATPQSGKMLWHSSIKRPANLGLLRFDQPAKSLSAIVRGLDFGNYANPLGTAKLWTGLTLLVVGNLKISDDQGGTPGEIISVASDSIVIAAADAHVALSDLSTLTGDPVDFAALSLQAGEILQTSTELEAELLKAVGRDEAQWEEICSKAVPAVPPYPLAAETQDGVVRAPLDLTACSTTQLSAAYLAWICALSGKSSATFALREPSLHPALSDRRLVSIDLTPDDTGLTTTAKFEAALEDARALAPMAADLPRRLTDPKQREASQLALSVIFASEGADEEVLTGGTFALIADNPRFVARGVDADILTVMAGHFSFFLRNFLQNSSAPLTGIALTDQDELRDSGTGVDFDLTIHDAFDQQAEKTPDAIALDVEGVTLTYQELKEHADIFASELMHRGAESGKVVGLCIERSVDLVVALLAILKSGAAYLPLDPDYPAERLSFMIENSGACLVVASTKTQSLLDVKPSQIVLPTADAEAASMPKVSSDELAYLIYTSGSTGTPKGVMVPHRAVQNFFAGMDQKIPYGTSSRFLAVTSISFDISVLELFWTLTRGLTLVLQTDGPANADLPGFSLFYFASEVAGTGHHAYRLLLEGAKFADENGFEAIWTPERHFHAFGGLYPNPAISAAMLAGITKNVKLRAGSSVLPLHHPIRVAEDWALVDNLSNGRAGIALASGWQPNDFVVRPDAFADRKNIMLENVDTLRSLWRGEKQTFAGHDGKPVDVEIHPKPMQADLPLWLTAAGNPETFAAAAQKGCGVLTHLLGQTVEEVSEKIKAYRVAWREAGHPGNGTVTLMLHTFVGDDEETVRETVRGPMKSYLKSAVDLVKRAAWTFPTIVERANTAGMSPVEMFEQEELSPEDLDQLLDHAFERYYMTSGLFGTPESAKDIVRQLTAIGVDEIGCLIDFGVDTDIALENLPNIKALMNALEAEGGVGRKASVAEEIVEKDITHLQCTPSMASMLAADEPGQRALSHLDVLMVGGEALPLDLARDLRSATDARFFNMYGPTETTIWSSCAELSEIEHIVPLGEPIANTCLDIRSTQGHSLPEFVAGELWIGGQGVTNGYWQQPDLTADRFVKTDDDVFYKTGDLVRRRPGGVLEFLGRIDNQIKIRGHRIELGEIESQLRADPSIAEAVAKAVEFSAGDTRLVAYVTSSGTPPSTEHLKQALSSVLPDFMVPSQFVVLDKIPLTPNGKVDRNALPHPVRSRTDQPAEAPDNETENIIYQVWRDALGIDDFSVNSNFFDLGGHSLLVVQVQRALKGKLDRAISITDVFRYPTVRKLSEFMSGETKTDQTAANRGAARAAARLARMGRR